MARQSRVKEPTPLAVVYLDPKTLVPYEKNARTHSDAQVNQIADSMTAFGFTNPILLTTRNRIVAGHGRQRAALQLGMATVPTIALGPLSEPQIKALIIADNKLAMNAGWDFDLLRLELGDLQAGGFNLDLTGFSKLELIDIFATKASAVDPDDVPPLPEKPISRLGDIWQLGPHRLACGDSTNAENVKALLDGDRPHLMVTDPPYGVEYDADWRNRAIRANGSPYGGRAVGKVSNDDRVDWSGAWVLFPGDVVYCWHADRHASSVQISLETCGFEMRAQIIWAKQQFAIGRGHYHFQHEPCYYLVRKGATGHWAGGRKQTTL